MVWIVRIQSIHAFGAHALKRKDITQQRSGLFKIARKEYAQLSPSLLHPNCSQDQLTSSTAHVYRVIIDNLLLFLRVADNLINLLILELRRMDGIENAYSLTKPKLRISLTMSHSSVIHARYHSNFTLVKNLVP